jgi:hypothetical protein
MKDEFIGFYKLTEPEYKILWENATFVFDANVLLNLYRFRKKTAEELIGVMDKLSNRVWIPYHAALEYQRNRLAVIAKQNTKFNEVRKVVGSVVSKLEGDLGQLDLIKRHSTINTDTLLADIKGAVEKFTPLLDAFESGHFRLDGEDQIRARLEIIFNGRVGPKPDEQEQVIKLEKLAEERFKKKIPPGYMDYEKDKSDVAEFAYGGINYRGKYGDFIIWEQVIAFASSSNLTDLIFVTDDNKEDWLFKIDQEGKRTVGPRPELIDELLRRSNVKRFNIYSSENFLKYSGQFLSMDISDDSIRDAALPASAEDSFSKMFLTSVDYVYFWLKQQHKDKNIEQKHFGTINIIQSSDNLKIGYSVIALDPNRSALEYLPEKINEALREQHSQGDITQIAFVLVSWDVRVLNKHKQEVKSISDLFPVASFIIGLIHWAGSSDGEFLLLDQFGGVR